MTMQASSVSDRGAIAPIGIAVLGMGNVGTEVVRVLRDNARELEARVGAPVVLRGVAVRSNPTERGLPVELIMTDAAELVTRSDVDVVVEVIGGIDPSRALILSALNSGKSVVTANKALLAEYTGELAAAAERYRADLYFEGAVATAVPIVRPLIQSLSGDRVDRVVGIVNGTTNFILSAMDESGADYDSTLAEATRLGYAEADPTADVEGFDAASKAAILASLAFHTRVTAADVYREGITGVTADDLRASAELDCTIKLLAICERVGGPDEPTPAAGGVERVSVRVYPALVPRTHPLASVTGSYNAVVVEAENAGRLMFYGRGAGGAPTASAVMGDVVMAARNRFYGGRAPGEYVHAQLPIAPIGDAFVQYYVNMQVVDRPGVLASVATEFAKSGVSISTVRQSGDGDDARLVVVTHRAKDSALVDTVSRLSQAEYVIAVRSVLRMEAVDQ